MDNKKYITCVGEILLRLSSPGKKRLREASGLEINVAGAEINTGVALSNFGMKTRVISRLPENDLGKLAEVTIRKHGMDTSHIVWGGRRMGLYFLEHPAGNRSGRVIYDRKNSSFSEVKPDMFNWDEVLEDTQWLHWSGITPALSKNTEDLCLHVLDLAKKKKIKVSGDLNYRSKLWKNGKHPEKVIPGLVQKSDWLNIDPLAAEKMLGIKISGNEPVRQFKLSLEKVKSQFENLKGVTGLCRLENKRLTGLIYTENKHFNSDEYALDQIVDRVGAGDAFVAGIIYGLIKKMDLHETVHFATATSGYKHTLPGDFLIANTDDIYNFMKQRSGIIER